MSELAIPETREMLFDKNGKALASLEDLFDSPILKGGASAVFDEGQLEDDKKALIGVPFVIRGVNYHLPKPTKAQPEPNGYITVTANIGSTKAILSAIEHGRIPNVSSAAQFGYQPGEEVKFNDGSTGVRRQLTALFDAHGLIKVGAISDGSDYDKPWPKWDEFSQHTFENDDKGEKVMVPNITVDRDGNPLMIVIRHGLRVSHMDEYDTDVFYLN